MPLIKDSRLSVTAIKCCGVWEIEYLSMMKSPEEALRSFWEMTTVMVPIFNRAPLLKKAFVIFTATTRPLNRHVSLYNEANNDPTYGPKFKKYLEDNNLGLVMESEERINVTSNHLKIYIWHIDWDRMAEFMKAGDMEEAKQMEAERLIKKVTSPSDMVEAINWSMVEEFGNVVNTNNTSGTGSGR